MWHGHQHADGRGVPSCKASINLIPQQRPMLTKSLIQLAKGVNLRRNRWDKLFDRFMEILQCSRKSKVISNKSADEHLLCATNCHLLLQIRNTVVLENCDPRWKNFLVMEDPQFKHITYDQLRNGNPRNDSGGSLFSKVGQSCLNQAKGETMVDKVSVCRHCT